MAVQLHERGLFRWPEFANALSKELKAAGADQQGEDYYRYWLAALETLVIAKGAVTEPERAAREAAWAKAAEAAPHGEPIELERIVRDAS